jgi:hypothetical protein
MGENKGGAGDVADFARAGGDVVNTTDLKVLWPA